MIGSGTGKLPKFQSVNFGLTCGDVSQFLERLTLLLLFLLLLLLLFFRAINNTHPFAHQGFFSCFKITGKKLANDTILLKFKLHLYKLQVLMMSFTLKIVSYDI